MNKIFKKIWNRRRGCFVAVSEAMTAACQNAGKSGILVGIVSSLLMLNPTESSSTTISSSTSVSAGIYDSISVSGKSEESEVELVLSPWSKEYPLALQALIEELKGGLTEDSIGKRVIIGSTFKDQEGLYSSFSILDSDAHGTSTTMGLNSYSIALRWMGDSDLPAKAQELAGSSGTGEDVVITFDGGLIKASTLSLNQTNSEVIYAPTVVAGYQNNKTGSTNKGEHLILWTFKSTLAYGNVVHNSSAVNNGSDVVIGNLNICPTCSYTQESGSTEIKDITGDGKVIINGGELITNGLLRLNPAQAANIAVKDLNSLADANAISYAAGTKASLGGFTAMSDKVQIGNATLKISGDYTQNIRNQATAAIQNKYGSGVNVLFTGSVAPESLDLSNGWTSAVLNSVFNENNRADYLFHTLNWNAEGQNKVIGSGDIQKNFGVKNVDNAGSIRVNNGATFAILGENASTTLAGKNFTADNGTLVFGAQGLSSGGLAGNVSVINNGTLKVASGDFTVDNLRANGTINNTGILRLTNFSFGENGRLTSSGTLQASQDKLFSIEDSTIDGLNVVSLGQTVPQNVRLELTELFKKYVSDNQKVLDEIVSHAQFTGGKVIVTGVNLTQTQADDLKKEFKSKFGSATTLEFQGTIAGISQDDKLTVAKVNELYDNVEQLRDVIYVDRKLEAQNQAVTVGNNGLKNNTGFTGINEATVTTIQDGKELTLIGAKSDGFGTRFTLADKLISVIGEGAKLILGSLGIQNSDAYQGQATEVNLSEGAELKVAAGDYKVTNHSSSGGMTIVDKGAVFSSDSASFTNTAEFTNNGTTSLGTLSGYGQATVTNNSKLTVEGETNLGGRLINNADAVLKGTANIDGVLENTEGANLYANTVNVIGTLRNLGYIEALDNSTVFGTLENPGTIKLFNTAIGNQGDINNTYTLTATGKTQVSGLLANAQGATAAFSGDDAELTVLNGGTVSNNGTLIADALTVEQGGYFINGDPTQTLSASTLALRANTQATEQLRTLTVSEGGTKTNNGIGYYAAGEIAGIFVNAEGAEAFGGVSAVFADGTGLSITNTGVIHNAGVFTFGGHLVNEGVIDGDGTVVFKRAGLGEDTFTNSGTITTGNLEADSIAYKQTAGTLTSENGWFSNSEVTLTGGTLEHDVLGEGNTYLLGLGTGNDSNAVFTVGTLDSSSEVNINKGATLRTEHIAMTGSKTTHLVGGRLSTTLDQVFSDLDYSTLNLDAENPEDKVDVISNPQIVTGVGSVINTVADGIEFAWGTVAFDDASYSAALAADVVSKLVEIGDVPSDRRGELEVAFNGKATEHFNVDLADSIKAVLPDGTSAYATFANETLYNESKGTPNATALTIGSSSSRVTPDSSVSANVLNTSMGFMQIKGAADGIYVNSGKHLVLVGKTDTNPNHSSIELADGAVFVGGADTSSGNAVPSKLTLGSYGTAEATRGHLAELNVGVLPSKKTYAGAGGQVIVKNGVFTVDTLNNGAAGYGADEAGIVIGSETDRTAELNVGSYTAVTAGTLLNNGVFHADTLSSIDNGNEIINRHEFSAGTMDWIGKLTNYADAAIDALTLRDAYNSNKAGASMRVGTLTIAGDDVSGDSGTLAIRGGLTNKGVLTVDEETVIAGDLVNENEFSSDKLSLKGDNGSFINRAAAKIDSLASEAATMLSNAADATLTVLGIKDSSEIAGTVENEGSLKVEGTQGLTLAENGTLNNKRLDCASVLSVAGGVLQNAGETLLNGITVTAGQVVNTVAGFFKDSGTTTVNMASADEVAVKNEAVLELTNLELLKGVIEGGTVGVKETTTATISSDGSVKSSAMTAQTVNNSGLISVSERYEAKDTQNTGVIEATSGASILVAQGDNFVNEAAGSVIAQNGASVDVLGDFINRGETSEVSLMNIGSTGVLTAQADTALNKVVASEGAVINSESGAIVIEDLTADGVIYNQTGGTLVADKGWFENSTLNIMGGILDASQVKDPEGNVTGLLGKNTVNISGPNKTPLIDNEDSPEEKAKYKENLSQVIAGTVNSDTIVNIESGGVLDVGTLDLDGTTEGTINLKGGVLQTSADQIFSSVTTEAIRLDAEDPESGTVQLPTTVLTATTVGAVKDEVKTGLNVQEGNLALDDDWFSTSLIVSVTDKLSQAFENAANLTVNFLGQMTAPFTVTTANDLEAEGLDVVLNPGIVLNTTTLHNEFADEYNKDTDSTQMVKGLVIGAQADDPAAANSINISMGFKNVTHADTLTIKGGKEFALVGNAVDAVPNGSYADESAKLLSDAADGGTVNVENGKFVFGSHGGATPTVGWINTSNVGQDGSLEAKNGEFANWTIANEGNVRVYGNAILHTNSYSGNGTGLNEGKFVFEEKDGNAPTFDVAGEFINKGELDAVKVDAATVGGTLTNEGKADYNNMDIAEGGSSVNSGVEKGQTLTVNGTHTNTGTSVWNGVTVAENGKGENSGSMDVGSVFDVIGEYVNKGAQAVLDAAKAAVANVSGVLKNEGTSNYDDMKIADGGKSENSGFEKGDILTIAQGGTHTNSGTSIWNNQTVEKGGSSVTEEGGKETINDKYVVEGGKTNKGEVDATGVENTEVSGTLDNQGKSEYDDMTVKDGGKSENSGYEKGDILTIDKGGEHDNSGTSIWNNVVVAGGDVSNTGELETGKLTIDDGTVKIDGGSLKADETDLNGGDLVIGNDKAPTPENRVAAEINPKDDVIDTNIYVKNNGDLNLGPDGGLDWADNLGAPTVPGGTPSRLVITTNITTGPGGGIAVGPNVWTDKDNHVEIGNGDLYFAKDSVTVIPANILTDGKSAFNTTSDIAKVTVEPGANLILGNIEEVGDYTIVNGYITGGNKSDGLWTGGWTGNNLYALPQDGSGINWVLTLHNDPSKIWVNAVLDDVRSVYPDIAVPNIANDDMLHCKLGDAGADFVCRVLRDKQLDVAGKTKVLNSVANIAFAGGAMSVAMNDLSAAADSIEGRVSMKGDAFTSDGLMRDWEKGNNLWVDIIGGKQKYKSLSATGISKAGYKTNSYGLVMGFDRKLENKPVLLGGAFSYNHGSLDSAGDVLKTKNKYNSFGLHAYGAYSPSEKLNIVGTLSWMHNASDITQSINAAGFNKAEADVKTKLVSAGLRAESTFKAGSANIVPHAGVRYVRAKSDKYDTKVDGKKVWSNKADATNTFQVPIGVAVRGDFPTANGWNIRPQADVTVISQFGDTKQKTKLSNFNGVTDKVSGEFAGKFGTNVNLGVQADKGNATVGFRYGFTGGTKGKADHAFKLEARYRF